MHMISCPHCGTMIRVDGGVANAPPYQMTGGSFDGDSSHTRNIRTSAATMPVSLPSITEMIKGMYLHMHLKHITARLHNAREA